MSNKIKTFLKQKISESLQVKKLPMTALLQRKSIRLFPNDVMVGIYYSTDLDKYIVLSTQGQVNNVNEEIEDQIDQWVNEEIIDEASRFKIVRVRVRRGKIERRKKVSTIKGYTFRGGKIVRMSAVEKKNRRMGQRRGKIKRRAKIKKIILKRKKSLRKLKAAGGNR